MTTAAERMNRILKPEPDGGEYCLDVSFLDGSDESLAYSTEDLARQAFTAIGGSPSLRVKSIRLMKELDWLFPGHDNTITTGWAIDDDGTVRGEERG